MREEVPKRLESIVGEDWVVHELRKMEEYLLDETSPDAIPEYSSDVILVKPANSDEISNILKYANDEKIPVIPRGGGTGLVAGAVPTEPSVILSLERLNKIVEIDEDNLMAVCEAGVTLGELIKRADETENLSFPLHPGDEGSYIGGIASTNAGGARAVKYGITRNYVKGIEAVLPTGEVTELGGKLLKDNTGYDLMHLLIGSEGTLGIITKVMIRLQPKGGASATLVVPYENRHDAVNTAPRTLQEGIIPLGIEYVEKPEVKLSSSRIGEKWPAEEGNAFLIVMLEGKDEEEVYSRGEEIVNICQNIGAIDALIAEEREEQRKILDIRSEIYPSLKPDTVDILDVVVPPADIGKLMDKVDEISDEFDTRLPMYGHVGDGNLHAHVMKVDGEVPSYYDEIVEKVYKGAIELNGTITGEHGIGILRTGKLPYVCSGKEIELMKGIKRAFDPNNILNPGKALP